MSIHLPRIHEYCPLDRVVAWVGTGNDSCVVCRCPSSFSVLVHFVPVNTGGGLLRLNSLEWMALLFFAAEELPPPPSYTEMNLTEPSAEVPAPPAETALQRLGAYYVHDSSIVSSVRGFARGLSGGLLLLVGFNCVEG